MQLSSQFDFDHQTLKSSTFSNSTIQTIHICP
jgi:hypothetical protein